MNSPVSLAATLCDRFSTEELRRLREEPATAIPAIVPGVSVELTETITDEAGCSIDGTYNGATRTIVVRQATSLRRTTFSLLHELGHDQARRNETTAAHLGKLIESSPQRRHRFEEQLADAFAAEILIPEAVVNNVIGTGHPRPEHLRDLYNHPDVGASREACAVRIAQRMPSNGYVIVATNSTIQFCASARSAPHVPRNSPQPDGHLLERAARIGVAVDDSTRLRRPSGSTTSTYAARAVTDAGYTYAVLTEATKPPWGDWRPRPTEGPLAAEIFCGDCDDTRDAWNTCDSDPTHRTCSTCGWCHCRESPRVAEQQCPACWLTKPVNQFDAVDGPCTDCA